MRLHHHLMSLFANGDDALVQGEQESEKGRERRKRKLKRRTLVVMFQVFGWVLKEVCYMRVREEVLQI